MFYEKPPPETVDKVLIITIEMTSLSLKGETLAQVFSCESCEISKKIFFKEHFLETASA